MMIFGKTESATLAETSSSSTALLVLMNVWCYSMLLFWTLFCILIFPFAFGLSLLFSGWSASRAMRFLVWIYGRGWLLLMCPFVRFQREQMDHLEKGKPYLFVINHLSFFDTYCMALLPVHDITFAIRSWPFRMIWYKGFMRLARYIDVESNSWKETRNKCTSTFASCGSVLFFPEGHRSRDGHLQRFYSGGFRVALASGVPIIPLCIVGTDRLQPPGQKMLQPCTIRLRALSPIDTSEFNDELGHITLRKLVKERMRLTLEEMRAEDCS